MFRTSPFILAAKRGGGGAKKPAFVSSGKRSPDSSSDSATSPLPGSSDSTYKRGALARASSQSVLDTFLQIQLGTWSPAPQTARQVLLTHFGPKLMQMQLSEAKLAAMDPKRVTKLLKQTLYEQYLAVPFTVLSFDLEFTGIPNFSGGGGGGESSTTKMNKSSSSSDAKKDSGDGEQSMLSDDLLVGEEEGDGNKSSSGDEHNSMAGGGPSEDIVEIALYDPDRKKLFSQLVLPYNNNKMSDGAAMLTGIKDEELQAKGKPLIEAWNAAVDFIEETMRHNVAQRMEQARAETEALNRQRESAANPFSFESAVSASNAGSTVDHMKTSNNSDFMTGDAYKNNQAERLLLLSHGARLVDIAMINWVQTLDGAKQLPPQTTTFGDTLLQIKDLHRRRPVTKDKWPAAWSLEDIATFLNLKVESTHRAGPDAKLTWEALYHSLDRYGDESLTPRQQLVGRFFDHDAKSVLNAYDVEQQQSRLGSSSSSSSMLGKGTAKIGQGLNFSGKDSSSSEKSKEGEGSAGFSVL